MVSGRDGHWLNGIITVAGAPQDCCVEQEAGGSWVSEMDAWMGWQSSPRHAAIWLSFQSLGWIGPTARTVPGDKSIFLSGVRRGGCACALNGGKFAA
ncbi:MAG TPA: hypothetical protein VH308_05695 [Terracidiphilus sp.]|nr:hypothetical protein [Terracidiphilus sp.]